ncbi:hypothetical protein JAAARDRAFT_29180 [Jaapia argillacea MUCL 33604]|uniref:Uncharacterized protein n=1 Tax=Jaapia argillacea MUCL 33604 TaxID=933084 RepID=A0A067Q7Z8_9AGAM|nr:hypothetical protein JAAARDRAFT_29180 [Jaapia argillacea MUCL 33604]
MIPVICPIRSTLRLASVRSASAPCTRLFATVVPYHPRRPMGKKKSSTPSEDHLKLSNHHSASESSTPIVDTHTHLSSTFNAYRSRYKEAKHSTLLEFMKAMYEGHKVEAIVDVWCEAPVQKKEWKALADSAITEEGRNKDWGGIQYWFVMGVHPHEAKLYTDAVEKDILEAMAHPRCVGWGEIGLDYHYDNSPRETQQEVLTRQLRQAVRLGKPITIHTREAEEDTERILKAEVPRDHKIHVHCFTDSPEFALRLMEHFPNLYIGITGVITYTTNLNTAELIRRLASSSSSLRIVLETDAPYMIPSNIYSSLPALAKNGGGSLRLPLSHTAMIPWTAEFVAGVAGDGWDTEKVMRDARANAGLVYGV